MLHLCKKHSLPQEQCYSIFVILFIMHSIVSEKFHNKVSGPWNNKSLIVTYKYTIQVKKQTKKKHYGIVLVSCLVAWDSWSLVRWNVTICRSSLGSSGVVYSMYTRIRFYIGGKSHAVIWGYMMLSTENDSIQKDLEMPNSTFGETVHYNNN